MTVIILLQSRQNGRTAAARLAEETVKPCVLYSLSISFCPFLFLCSHLLPITSAKPLKMKYICMYLKDGRGCVFILMQVLVWVCL